MPKVDCIKLLRQAGIVSDTEAKQLLAKMQSLAEQRAAARGLSFEKAMAEIAGELKLADGMGRDIQKRNGLMTLQTRQWAKEYAKRFKTWGKGVEALLFGDPSDVKGAGLGVWQIWQGLWSRYASRFIATIEKAGAFEDFQRGRFAKEFYLESEALGVEGGGRATKNDSAYEVAKAWKELRTELVARMNQAGAFIKDMPGYVLMQTHDRGQIVRLDPKNMGESHKQWWATTQGFLDIEKTFSGSDPLLASRAIHKNLYTGNHESYLDTFDVDTFRAHGALANKVSSPRVLWFKDAESAFKYNEMFGMKDYNQAILFHMRQMTKNIALMEKLGPNPVENYRRIIKELGVEAKDRNDSNAQTKALEDTDSFMRKLDVVTGRVDIPHNPTLSRWFGLARALRLVSTGGKMVFSSFGDRPMMQSHMTWLGMTNLDAFGKSLAFKTSAGARRDSVAIGLVPQSLTGHVAHRWGFERSNGNVSDWVHRFFSLNWMNWWSDVSRSVMGDGTVAHIGAHADLPMEALPMEVGRALRHYDISAKEWNAIRKTAYDAAEGPLEGNKVITSDTFDRVPDVTLDALAVDRGLTANQANRNRQRDLLKQKFEGLLIDSVDTGVPTPGAREKYITTFGGRAQAGTWFGELARSVMMYKSFPLTVAMKVLGRELYGGGDGLKAHEWLMSRQGKFRVAQLIAMAGIAGYAGMVAKDALRGRTPKPLFVDGRPNMDVWFASLQQGGGLGIYGDFLFSEYDSRYRSFLGAAAGPVLGQLDPLASLVTQMRGAATGKEDVDAEKIGHNAWRLAEQNMPFAGLFYVKPVLDYFIFWNVKEMLSPGVLRRQERSVRDKAHQDFFITPSEDRFSP